LSQLSSPNKGLVLFRLLYGIFKLPSAAFNPKFEFCAGHQLFENMAEKTKSLFRNAKKSRIPPKVKILKKQTENGETFYIKLKTDWKGNV
jgi:hypothetical protein